MGAWGEGIFENDLSLDVRGMFEDLLESGESVASTTSKILEEFADEIEDEDQKADVYLALAMLQMERNELNPEIRQLALDVIEDESTLEIWGESGDEEYHARKSVFQEVKQQLLRYK